MKKPEYIALSEFDYDLPEDRIAKYPLQQRDKSKLLVYRNHRQETRCFSELTEVLASGTHLVFNNSEVIHARLKFRKKTGSKIEIFCLEPSKPFDYERNLSSSGSVEWKCMIGNSKKWKSETLSLFDEKTSIQLNAVRKPREGLNEIISFSWKPEHFSFSEIIEIFGHTPIPPYLDREAEDSDALSYQTVYSMHKGSVAAPTAGLHFTDELIRKLKSSGIPMTEVTLHVGAGTFTPVKVENSLDHEMHIERFHISRDNLRELVEHSEHITAVGTTSCRTLESIYWMGVKMKTGFHPEECLYLGQFEAYKLNHTIDRKEALEALLSFMEAQNRELFLAATGIMISPGYRFRMTDALITNFHQPKSTLLMLIAALVGDAWKNIYKYALENDYRFLSYGDSSILFPD